MNVTHREGKICLSWTEEVIGSETGKGSTNGGTRHVEIPVHEFASLEGKVRGVLEDARLWAFQKAEREKREAKHKLESLLGRTIKC